MLLAGSLLAWAILFRVWSNVLFAALTAYLTAWVTAVVWALHALHLLLGSSPHKLPQLAQSGPVSQQLEKQQQQEQAYHPQQRWQWWQAHGPEDNSGYLLDTATAQGVNSSHPGHRTGSPTESAVHNSSKSGSSSSTMSRDGAGHLLTGIARAAEQRMLQAFSDAGATHEGLAGAAAVWATSVALAKRLSEPGPSKPPQQSRRTSVSVCPPPLEYEASEELQQELEAAAPESFLCPLGRVLMVDPVFTPSGFTYHKPCITRFIARTGRDPAHDATPLSPSQLCPNVNLRDQIADWLQRQGVHT